MPIHPTAIVDPAARIAESAEIGPYCIIGADVEIGPRTRLMERLFLVTRRPANPTERLVCLAEAGYYGRFVSDIRLEMAPTGGIAGRAPRMSRAVLSRRQERR